MRISLISEAGSRRDFLRQMAGGAVAASTGNVSGVLNAVGGGIANILTKYTPLAKIFNSMPDDKQWDVAEFVWDFINNPNPTKFFNNNVKDGYVLDDDGNPSFPVKAVLGRVVASSEDPYDMVSELLTGDNPEAYNLIMPNFTSDMINYGIQKFGAENLVNKITEIACDAGSVEIMWGAALNSPILQNMLDITKQEFVSIHRSGRGFKKLVDKGMVTPEYAKSHLEFIRNQQFQSKQRQREHEKEQERLEQRQQEYEYEQEQLEQRRKQQKPETYTPRNDDYIYGSAMHQPFESKLKKALGLL